MTWIDYASLLATGLVCIYLLWRLYTDYGKVKQTYDIYYMLSFAVLLVAGLLLLIFGFEALESPWVIIVAVLIPGCLALGLVSEFYQKYEKPFLVFLVVGLLAIAATRLFDIGSDSLATIVLIIVHATAGLLIFIIPILAVTQDKAPGGFIWVTIGGVLIGLGGIALAFLKTGNQLLFFSPDFVFDILTPLLLLMTLAFTWGFMKKIRSA